MRNIAAVSVLLLAASPLAAKPVPPTDDAVVGQADTANRWRSQAISLCIDRLHAVPGLTPDNLESICGCAANETIETNGAGPLPPIEQGELPMAMRGRLMMCTSRIRPERAGEVMRIAMAPAPVPAQAVPAPATDAKPPGDDMAVPTERETADEGGGFWEWVGSLRLPDWLTGAGALLWVALGILVFGLLILKVRRRDPRGDLTGPPPSMRRGAPPQPPRRPDLPR